MVLCKVKLIVDNLEIALLKNFIYACNQESLETELMLEFKRFLK